jgi:serine/threonine protein kinase
MEKVSANLSYSPTDILGEGRFSTVYEGILHNYKGPGDITVAVKRFSKKGQNEKIVIDNPLLHKTKHPNIVDYYITQGSKNFK